MKQRTWTNNKKYNKCGHRNKENFCTYKGCVVICEDCKDCWYYQHYITMSRNLDSDDLDYDYNEWN